MNIENFNQEEYEKVLNAYKRTKNRKEIAKAVGLDEAKVFSYIKYALLRGETESFAKGHAKKEEKIEYERKPRNFKESHQRSYNRLLRCVVDYGYRTVNVIAERLNIPQIIVEMLIVEAAVNGDIDENEITGLNVTTIREIKKKRERRTEDMEVAKEEERQGFEEWAEDYDDAR